MTERGINALGLYIAAQTATDIAPDTMGCIREYPKTELQFDQPVPQGTYWSMDDFKRYSDKNKGRNAAIKTLSRRDLPVLSQ